MTKKTAPPTTREDPVVEDPIAAARAEVVKLNNQELRLAMLYRSKAGELASVKAERGDQVLDAVDQAGAARDVSRRVSAVLGELESFTDGANRARERRLAVIPAVFRADAAQLEREAEQLEAEATKLQAESNRRRQELEAFDECIYMPVPPTMPEYAIGAQQGGAVAVLQVRVPRFERLRLEAQGKRSEAAQTRVREPHRAGAIEADNLDNLLAAVFAGCTCAICRGRAGMRIQPPIDAIITWAQKAVETERRRRTRLTNTADAFVPVDAPMRLHLEWRGGVIDQPQSRVLEPEPEPVVVFLTQPPAPEQKAPAKPAPDPRRRTPFDTKATPYEVRREAAATGETVAAIAERWGVPVPSGIEPEVAVVPTQYAIRQEAAVTGESIEAVAKRFGVPVPKELAQVEAK